MTPLIILLASQLINAPLGKWHQSPNPAIPQVPSFTDPRSAVVPPDFLRHPTAPQAGDICYQFTPDQNVRQLCTNSVPKYCSVDGKFHPNIGKGAPFLWSCFSADGKRSWVIDSEAVDKSAWDK